jgi:hypothetical protein
MQMQLLVDAEKFVEAQKYSYVADKFKALCKESDVADIEGITKITCEKLLKAHKKAAVGGGP